MKTFCYVIGKIKTKRMKNQIISDFSRNATTNKPPFSPQKHRYITTKRMERAYHDTLHHHGKILTYYLTKSKLCFLLK